MVCNFSGDTDHTVPSAKRTQGVYVNGLMFSSIVMMYDLDAVKIRRRCSTLHTAFSCISFAPRRLHAHWTTDWCTCGYKWDPVNSSNSSFFSIWNFNVSVSAASLSIKTEIFTESQFSAINRKIQCASLKEILIHWVLKAQQCVLDFYGPWWSLWQALEWNEGIYLHSTLHIPFYCE